MNGLIFQLQIEKLILNVYIPISKPLFPKPTSLIPIPNDQNA
jgi:hypothetical protein